jgi:hypothetical protein
MLSGSKLFENKLQKLQFISALDEQHTVYGYEALVAHCLPVLIDMNQKGKQNASNSPSQVLMERSLPLKEFRIHLRGR